MKPMHDFHHADMPPPKFLRCFDPEELKVFLLFLFIYILVILSILLVLQSKTRHTDSKGRITIVQLRSETNFYRGKDSPGSITNDSLVSQVKARFRIQ